MKLDTSCNQNHDYIIADFDGKIGKREIAQGVLGSNSLIITLDDLKKIIIDIKVPENYVGVLKPGLKAEITSSAFNKVFKGKIETISSRIDPSTRSILSRVIVDNSKFEIIPGQLMTVKIIYEETDEIGVPESAVTIQGETAFVYIVNNEIAEIGRGLGVSADNLTTGDFYEISSKSATGFTIKFKNTL